MTVILTIKLNANKAQCKQLYRAHTVSIVSVIRFIRLCYCDRAATQNRIGATLPPPAGEPGSSREARLDSPLWVPKSCNPPPPLPPFLSKKPLPHPSLVCPRLWPWAMHGKAARSPCSSAEDVTAWKRLCARCVGASRWSDLFPRSMALPTGGGGGQRKMEE